MSGQAEKEMGGQKLMLEISGPSIREIILEKHTKEEWRVLWPLVLSLPLTHGIN